MWFAVTVAAEATSSPKARTAWEARIVPSRVAKCRAVTAVTVEIRSYAAAAQLFSS